MFGHYLAGPAVSWVVFTWAHLEKWSSLELLLLLLLLVVVLVCVCVCVCVCVSKIFLVPCEHLLELVEEEPMALSLI